MVVEVAMLLHADVGDLTAFGLGVEGAIFDPKCIFTVSAVGGN